MSELFFVALNLSVGELRVTRKRKQKRQPTRKSTTVEDRRAEVATVAWMLSMISTLGAELVGGLLQLVLSFADSPPAPALAFARLMLFTAAVTGIVCLSLTPLVYRFRLTPPPTGVAVFAVAVSVFPLATALMLSLK